jgi:hypothetical protein
MPSAPTGRRTTSCPRPRSQSAVSSTAACSIAVTTMRSRRLFSTMPLIAQLSASVAPLVKCSLPSGPNGAAIRSRTSSTVALAARPMRCGEWGLPKPSSHSGRIASNASGASGVVA